MDAKIATSRPRSVAPDKPQPIPDIDPALTRKLDFALGTVSLFLDSQKIVHAYPIVSDGMEDNDHDTRIVCRELSPKETAAYHAALNFLERFFDADNGAMRPAT